MKKLCCAALTLMLLTLLCVPALADTWYCPQCGRLNDSNFCPSCGTARPTSSSSGYPSSSYSSYYPQYAYVTGVTNQKLATRTGPSTKYDEPGTYLSANSHVTVLSKAYDTGNGIWWVQVDMSSNGARVRAYTGQKRFSSLNMSAVPEEHVIGSCYVSSSRTGYYGPSSSYKRISRQVPGGIFCDIYGREDLGEGAYVQIEFFDSGLNRMRRAWIPEWYVSDCVFFGSY